ncbi:MAG: hypothetical protein JWM91_4011, partial [Rhodospirillales bacterium]|nr:hypothetical protein [Rhodospirillales bacterium]
MTLIFKVRGTLIAVGIALATVGGAHAAG